jgi:integrase
VLPLGHAGGQDAHERRDVPGAGLAVRPREAGQLVEQAAGLREGELLGLRWKDVNLEHGTLEVRQQLIRTRDGRFFDTTKSGAGRDILMLPVAILALKGHLERQREERAGRGELWQDFDLVFPTTIGTPMDVNDLTYRSFRPLLGRAGLPRKRFHDLRHTYATLMLRVDAHPRTVQDILGHAEFGVTMDTYTHPSLDSQREPARRLDELLDL